MVRNVVIIGSGAAGYTAAIYAARADLEPVLYMGLQPGGQLTITTDVENYPGFPEGVLGPELMDLMYKQAHRFGTDLRPGKITKVDLSRRPFTVFDGKEEVETETIIAATGASAKLLGVPGEDTLMGHGVSACATCDGAFFRDVEVCVVGGGDSAMEEATFLTRFASRVTIIHRREEFRASKIMLQRAQNDPKIEFLTNTTVEAMLPKEEGVEKLGAVRLKNAVSGEESTMAIDGCFVAIGHKPNTDIFEGQLEMDEKGYLVAKPDTSTSVEGVFAAGDVADSRYRQAVTAAGTGCMAALEVEDYLEMREFGA